MGVEVGVEAQLRQRRPDLRPRAASSSQINLSWIASSGATGYTVYRSTTSGFAPSSSNQIARGVTTASYSNTGLTASIAYYYVLEAVNSSGSSGPSSQASATTQSSGGGGSAPVAPTGLTATAASSSQINLSWTASSGATSYTVYRSTTSGFTPSPSNQIVSGVTPGSYSNTGLTASTTYYYVVEAVNSSGSSGPSSQVSATTQSSGGGGGNGAFTAGRTKYVRTDATTEYFASINSRWIVYSPITNRFFVTDPSSNRVTVLDAATETEIAVIGVPGAYSIDDTPDHRTLYVSTLVGDLYAVDPVAMTVIKRYISSQIGPDGYFAFSAVVLADGRLALLAQPGGIPSVDGETSFAIWNPIDNSLVQFGSTPTVNAPPAQCGVFMGNIGGFSRTVDRTKIIIASIDSDATLCEMDELSGQTNYVGGSSFKFTTTPNGKYILMGAYPNGVNVYDAQTLAPLTQFPVNGDTASDAGLVLSADSKTLYVPNGGGLIYAYDMSSHQQIGWLPNMFVPQTSGGFTVGPATGPNLQAVDGTGLLAGPLEQGVGFIDTSILRTGAVGTQFTNGYLDPATGPPSGGTSIQLYDPNPLAPLSAMFFGPQRATNLSASSSGLISANTPPGSPGPVDVYTFTTDGGFQILPEGFSYGPAILQVSPNVSSAEGGGTGYVFGYGFGPFTTSAAVPSSLQVTVGGALVQTTALYSIGGGGSPPFQLQALAYVIPAGAAGSAADVTVTSSSVSATAPAALSYLPAVQQFPLSGAALAQGIYDSYRDVYYFTDTSKIQVFSKTLGRWLAPISIAAPPGAAQRLWGIALSPDGTKLAVADIAAGVIYELNPLNPAAVKTFTVSATVLGPVSPVAVAISNAGAVYYATMQPPGSGAHGFFKLDTNTGAVTDYGIGSPGVYINGSPQDVFLHTVISSDNSRVFFNADGYIFSIDTATDKVFAASVDVGCCYGDYELALSSNQIQFSASSYLFDSNLNGESYLSLNDREILTAQYVYGNKLSPDGSLLFQPSVSGIDILDGRLGNLLRRVSLPVFLSENYDALVPDGKDNILLAITGVNGDGIGIVDLTSLSEPPPLPYAAASPVRAKRLVGWGRARPDVRIFARSNSRPGSTPAIPRMAPHVTNFKNKIPSPISGTASTATR